jgi:dihydroneopterin aldolase
MSIKELANEINTLTNEYKYFWSYGLLKETAKLWRDKNNYNLLNEFSQTICDTVFESLAEQNIKA